MEFSILDAFYGFKKVWLFHCSPLHSFQSEKYRLTWDGKIQRPFQLNSSPEGVLPISSDRDDRIGGKNQTPKKSLDQNLPPKKSHAEFPSHYKNFQEA